MLRPTWFSNSLTRACYFSTALLEIRKPKRAGCGPCQPASDSEPAPVQRPGSCLPGMLCLPRWSCAGHWALRPRLSRVELITLSPRAFGNVWGRNRSSGLPASVTIPVIQTTGRIVVNVHVRVVVVVVSCSVRFPESRLFRTGAARAACNHQTQNQRQPSAVHPPLANRSHKAKAKAAFARRNRGSC